LMGGQYSWLRQAMIIDGTEASVPAFAEWELLVAKAIYWVGVPAIQFALAILWVDTWQYFWHRAMHMNKWLYSKSLYRSTPSSHSLTGATQIATFHSRHHRLYVPYAYGALYNHPFEGFLLDTLGAGLAYLVTGMTVRQSMWFFTLSTIKTVDDHCGYALPFDPIQHLTSNNAAYHDVHHQSWGIKTNFSQPFFTFWDRILGTMWTGGDVSLRYERARVSAQKKVDADNAAQPITHSSPTDSATANLRPYADERATHLPSSTHQRLKPAPPAGKAESQALGSREQVLDDPSPAGGANVLLEEMQEEERERASQGAWLRRSPRKTPQRSRAGSGASSSLMGLRDRVGESLVGSCVGDAAGKGVNDRRRL
jgi:sphinganine C4-monooxygenase